MKRIESAYRLTILTLLLPCSLFAMERIEQAPQAMANQVRPVHALTELALPKFFEYCNLNNIDASQQTRFPKEKLLELVKQSPWAWAVFAPRVVKHFQRVNSARFSSDSKKIITTSNDRRALVIDSFTGAEIMTVWHDTWVTCAELSPNMKMIATGSIDGTVKIIDMESGSVITKINHAVGVTSVRFSPNSTMVVTACADSTARIINIEHNDCIEVQSSLRINQFSPDSKYVITAYSDITARVLDAATGRSVATIDHNAAVNYAEFSPDGKRVVTASGDRTVKIADAKTGAILANFEHDALVNFAYFSPCGTRIITVCDASAIIGKIRVIDIESRETVMTFVGHNAGWSPDGKKIVIYIYNKNEVRVYNISSGLCIFRTTHLEGGLISAQFSPNSMMIVSASFDQAKICGLPVTDDDELLKRLQEVSGKRQSNMIADSWQNFLQTRLVRSIWYTASALNRRPE